MAIKDWKKTKNANNQFQKTWFKETDNGLRWITIKNIYGNVGKIIQYEFIYLSKDKHITTRKFKTKSKALTYAKSYMRKY